MLYQWAENLYHQQEKADRKGKKKENKYVLYPRATKAASSHLLNHSIW